MSQKHFILIHFLFGVKKLIIHLKIMYRNQLNMRWEIDTIESSGEGVMIHDIWLCKSFNETSEFGYAIR